MPFLVIKANGRDSEIAEEVVELHPEAAVFVVKVELDLRLFAGPRFVLL